MIYGIMDKNGNKKFRCSNHMPVITNEDTVWDAPDLDWDYCPECVEARDIYLFGE